MEWLKIVSKKHNEYISIVRSFPENKNNKYIEDIVQDTYIELSKLGSKKHKENDKRVNKKYKDLTIAERVLNNNGDVNMIFIWIILKWWTLGSNIWAVILLIFLYALGFSLKNRTDNE